ncbi:MAG TPA: M48 family metalloprotease, partial [Coriobacteriia bacterium]
RVDQNRLKLAAFVALFVGGSAVLLTASMVALPGWLLGWGADQIDLVAWDEWFATYPWVVGGALGLLLLVGGLIAAVQLANAEDWVRNRFKGSPVAPDDLPGVTGVVEDISIAAGLPVQPQLLLLDVKSVNACAIGTRRDRPVIGVTQGFLTALTADEQRAVVATLVARIAAGDVLFATALAALMGPLKAIRGSAKFTGAGAGCAKEACTSPPSCTGSDFSGCGDGCNGCSGCADIGDIDSDSAGGCAFAIVVVVFLAVVAAITYAAVLTAAWIVTWWGRSLHRTTYEKADAEGMLLLKDPSAMLSALDKVIRSNTEVGDGDPSYDGIFYASTSGKKVVDALEQRRFDRLREVLGTEGLAARTPEIAETAEPAEPAVEEPAVEEPVADELPAAPPSGQSPAGAAPEVGESKP